MQLAWCLVAGLPVCCLSYCLPCRCGRTEDLAALIAGASGGSWQDLATGLPTAFPVGDRHSMTPATDLLIVN